jgi:ADP-heptose:LPS heptosyltransferase
VKNRSIKKILLVTLTNLGDALMSLPTLDVVRQRFPAARITIVAGPRIAGLFEGNPLIERFLAYDKHAALFGKLRFFRSLQAENFDAVIDLRDSLFGHFLGTIRRPLFIPAPTGVHEWRRHLVKARFLLGDAVDGAPPARGSIVIAGRDREYADSLLRQNGIRDDERPIVICPGARSNTKCWSKDNYYELAKILPGACGRIVVVGDANDRACAAAISRDVPGAVDLAGKTSLLQLAHLLTRAGVVICNDTGTMHLASYLNTPVAALFGPSDDFRYGPWSPHSRVVKTDIACRPCQKAQCVKAQVWCLTRIHEEDVKDAVLQILQETREKS